MLKKIITIIISLLLIGGVVYATQTGLTGINQEEFLPYTKHHHFDAGAASLGPTAPTVDQTGTAICLAFDNNNEQVGLSAEVAEEWDGASDMQFNIDWYPQDGTAIGAGETVIFDLSWRAIAYGEAVDNGTVATATITYTQSGGGTDKEYIDSTTTIAYTGGNQPLTVDDNILFTFSRDFTADTYGADVVVCDWYLNFTANKLPTF